MNARNRLLIAAAVVCAAAARAEDFVRGPWSMRIGAADMTALKWKGETLVLRGGLRAYAPGWKKKRFDMNGARIARGADSVVWSKNTPGNQTARLTAAFRGAACRYSLDTTVYAAGPTEFWVQINPAGVRTDSAHCFVWINAAPKTISLRSRFEKIYGIKELRFEQPTRTVIVRCSGFELQDRRSWGSGLFLVKVIGSDGRRPRAASEFIEIEVREADPQTLAGRRVLLAQRPEGRKRIALKNPGFEENALAGWTHGPRAAVDRAVRRSGRSAARLTVQKGADARGNMYLIQKFPVVEGRYYQASAWVRAENARKIGVGGMWPVGATVILEFADKRGRWFAAGSYGPKQFGSFGWRRTRTTPVRAPRGAGFAIIYLALRGPGRAWFDDVEAFEVEYRVMLLNPLPGARVHDNTPQLDWAHPAKTWTTVELSPRPDFPAGQVVRFERVPSPPLQVEKPLAPGRWYWRVTAPGSVSDVWSFEQTAALTEDTTDPSILDTSGWLPAANAALRIRYADNVGVTKVRLVCDGRDVSAALQVGRTDARYVPPRGWTAGLHAATARVEDAAGNAAERALFFTYSKPLPRIVWRERGGLDIAGERRFLLGMYGVRIQDMPEIASAGFDFVHSYQWDGAGTNAEALKYLDAARKCGLRAFIGFNRRRLMAGDERFVAERVAALMRHPALLAWYLYDEPDLEHQYVSPMWLGRYYRLIKALDPFHPVVVTCARDDAVAQYRGAFDVHWTQVYGSTAYVASRLDKHRRALPPHTPLAAILHCYDRAQSARLRDEKHPPDPAKFQPDGRRLRANAFMAIAHNSSGLVWWWWGYGGGGRFFTVANAPQAWAALKRTIADIRELEPALTSDGEIRTQIERPAKDAEVRLWEKKLPDRVVLIAVNRNDKACDAVLKPQFPPKTCRLRARFGGRDAEVRGGRLRVSFEPLGVRVYEWRAKTRTAPAP